jgi:hypothetical protein
VIVRLLVGLAGRDFAFSAGECFTCDDATGARMIAAGQAEAVSREPEIERAVAAPVERAAKRMKR